MTYNPHVLLMRQQADALRTLDEKQLWRLALEERRAERDATEILPDWRFEIIWELSQTGKR